MIELFLYPVSAVMKFWYAIASHFTDNSTAWILSIVLLVITVRFFIAPFIWMSIKSARLGVLIRPENTKLDKELEKVETSEEAAAIYRRKEELKKEYGYSVAGGCLPMFIMFPFFVGLYTVVLRMAKPDVHDHAGLLNSADMASFRAAEWNGVPIIDLARDHLHFIMPLLVAAIIFTTLGTAVPLMRTYLTTEFDKGTPRFALWLMILMIPIVPWISWNAAAHSIVPVAVVIYWGCSYLFSLLQILLFEYWLYKKYRLTDAVHQARQESIKTWRRPRKVKKAEKKEAKAAKKAISKEDKQARAKMLAEGRKLLREENKAAKQGSKSNNPPEEPQA